MEKNPKVLHKFDSNDLTEDDDSVYEAADLLDGPEIDKKVIQQATYEMLKAFGEDPEREGLKRTPERVSKMYDELLAGYRIDPVAMVNDALFDVEYDEMVIVRDIEFYSLCEHHMLPFFGNVNRLRADSKDPAKAWLTTGFLA